MQHVRRGTEQLSQGSLKSAWDMLQSQNIPFPNDDALLLTHGHAAQSPLHAERAGDSAAGFQGAPATPRALVGSSTTSAEAGEGLQEGYLLYALQ